MTTISLSMFVAARPEICFDLVRNIDVHLGAACGHNQKAVAGVTTGLIGLGETVTWEGDYLFLKRRMTSKIVEFQRPVLFVDEMQQGDFHHWRHVHRFLPENNGTRVIDEVDLASPFGVIGSLVDWFFMKGYMTRLLTEHNAYVKKLAESAHAEDTPKGP